MQVVWHKIKPRAFTLDKLSDRPSRVWHHSLSTLVSSSSESVLRTSDLDFVFSMTSCGGKRHFTYMKGPVSFSVFCKLISIARFVRLWNVFKKTVMRHKIQIWNDDVNHDNEKCQKWRTVTKGNSTILILLIWWHKPKLVVCHCFKPNINNRKFFSIWSNYVCLN